MKTIKYVKIMKQGDVVISGGGYGGRWDGERSNRGGEIWDQWQWWEDW